MLYFYSGYILYNRTGQQLATSHGITNITECANVIDEVTKQMLHHYKGSFPESLLSVHIISINKVG